MSDLSQPEWVSQLESDPNAIVLDVRTQAEVDEGKISNAVHIDIHKGQGFIDEVEKLDRSKTYFVYCKVGSRSAQACAVMNNLGFENTHNLIGGFSQWAGNIE